MAHSSFKKMIAFLVILSITLPVQIVDSLELTTRFEVTVYNRLPQNDSKLITHCASAEDDLGRQTLYWNQYQRWSFRTHIFAETLFFCHFWWDRQDRAFDVFKASKSSVCRTKEGNVCSWVVEKDGFFFSPYRNFTRQLEGKYEWNA